MTRRRREEDEAKKDGAKEGDAKDDAKKDDSPSPPPQISIDYDGSRAAPSCCR